MDPGQSCPAEERDQAAAIPPVSQAEQHSHPGIKLQIAPIPRYAPPEQARDCRPHSPLLFHLHQARPPSRCASPEVQQPSSPAGERRWEPLTESLLFPTHTILPPLLRCTLHRGTCCQSGGVLDRPTSSLPLSGTWGSSYPSCQPGIVAGKQVARVQAEATSGAMQEVLNSP